MISNFSFKLEDKKIVITKCGKIFTREMVKEILSKNGTFSSIELCEGIEVIDSSAFRFAYFFEDITLPNSLIEIKDKAFYCCACLEKIKIPNSVKKIGKEAFSGCPRLESVEFFENLEEIGDLAFSESGVKKVVLPKGLKKIGVEAFKNCKSLEELTIEEGLEIISNSSFYGCSNLKKVSLPTSIRVIGEKAFFICKNLESIELFDKVRTIEKSAFENCEKLRKVVLPSQLKEIDNYVFSSCVSLENIIIPENVERIGASSFFGCSELNNVKIPNKVKIIDEYAFCNCYKLDNIEIGNQVEIIDSFAFCNCISLPKFTIPENLKVLGTSAFYNCYELKTLIVKDGDNFIEIDAINNRIMDNESKKLFLYNIYNRSLYGFYDKGKYIQFDKSIIDDNKGIKRIRRELGDNFMANSSYYIRLYYWVTKRFVPHYTIVREMPIDSIDNFYINNNCREWEKLIKLSEIREDINKGSFFKLCFVLGVFNSSVTERDKAVNFIKNNIIGKMSEDEIHARFDGFDLRNGFNKEYSEFFMKYFDTSDFMKVNDNMHGIVDLMAASYNNFKKVKEVYPSKIVNTNREADMLLPKHVVTALVSTKYDRVDKGNDNLALIVGKYGYTQEQFEEIQKLFNEGKNLKESDLKIFIKEDKKDSEISYELLVKDNPLGVVLGNITNCCQVIGGRGESCVEYGLSKPNSKFMTFNYKNTIIGQSWVWYDEFSETICLDNIEVPSKYKDLIKNNEGMQKAFVECLIRASNNFKEEMKNHGLNVKRVTIGKGYNDIEYILRNNFRLMENISRLSDYKGYSDANDDQYEIRDNRRKV